MRKALWIIAAFAVLLGVVALLLTGPANPLTPLLLLPLAGVVVDLRDKTQVYDGGSSKVALYLSAAVAQAVTGDGGAVEGWYQPSFQESSELGPRRQSEEVRDEASNLIKTRITQNEFILTTTFMQTNDAVLRLCEHLETTANAVKLRYPMPTDGSTTDQWLFGYNVNVLVEDWRIQTAENQDRSRTVTFVFSLDSNGDLADIVTLPVSQVDSAWDDYAAFKDTPA